jgi:hypothetical protein
MVAGFLAFFGAAYYFISGSHSGSADKGAKQKLTNPLQKSVEVTGVRIVSEDNNLVAKFLVVNHSASELADLAADVTLWASTSRSEEDSVGSFSFKIPMIGSNESKEMTAPLKTEKQAFQMPDADDWRNLTADVQVTSPSQ